MLVFSFFSFGLTLGIFYLWLLLLSILAGAGTPIHGWCGCSWAGLTAGRAGQKSFCRSSSRRCLLVAGQLAAGVAANHAATGFRRRNGLKQSLVIGLGSYLVWKFPVGALLVLHLLNSYIYFGKHPFWNYVNATAQTLLAPLRKIPLRAGKVDFAPVVGIAMVFFVGGICGTRPGLALRAAAVLKPVRPVFVLRKFDGDGRAGTFFAFNRKRAAVQFDEPLGNGQSQAQALLVLHFAVELHVSADAADLLGGKSAALVA